MKNAIHSIEEAVVNNQVKKLWYAKCPKCGALLEFAYISEMSQFSYCDECKDGIRYDFDTGEVIGMFNYEEFDAERII